MIDRPADARLQDHADFRKDHGDAIRQVCPEFVLLCRRLKLFADGIVAIDGSKFKAVNNRDKNFTSYKIEVPMRQLEHSNNRDLTELDRADRDPTIVLPERAARLRRRSPRSSSTCATSAKSTGSSRPRRGGKYP